MRIAHVNFSYDDSIRDEEELIRRHYTLTGWAEALQRKGAQVTVLNRFSKQASFTLNKVHYHFIKDGMGGRLNHWQLPLKFLKAISRVDASLFHLHHLSLPMQVFFLRQFLSRKKPIVIQHHGGESPPSHKRSVYNLFNQVADGFFFTTIEQGKEWFQSKDSDKIYPVMEGATFFNFDQRDSANPPAYLNREENRTKTGMEGSPVFLWVGRLDNNKDPQTVLDGCAALFEKYTGARLYMIYNEARLLEAVKAKIENTDSLRTRVHLLGSIDHDKMMDYYQSADYFLLGSHREGSGYALSEALRCGCIPIVTGIPSFRMMTNNGNLGALWPAGDIDGFMKAAEMAINKTVTEEAGRCIKFFNDHLSFDAIANASLIYYETIIRLRIAKDIKSNL
jgi:glycosyltransferase involved in cell wall biosynthesis